MRRRPWWRGPATLGGRLVLATLAFCALFTLLAVGVRTWFAWGEGVVRMSNELALMEQVYQHTLAKVIWEVDRDGLAVHLRSAAQVESIGCIEVLPTADGMEGSNLLAEVCKPGWKPSRLAPSRVVPLTYQAFPGQASMTLGELALRGDERVLWRRLRAETLNIALTQLIQSLALAGFIMLMFNRSVTVHVRRIASHLAALTPERLDTALVLRRRSEAVDELSQLVAGVNLLQANLSDYLAQQQAYENELARHRDHLAELVEERTSELSEANEALAGSAATLRQLGDIGLQLTTSLDQQAICYTLHKHLAELLPTDGFGVALLEPGGQALRLVYYVEDEQRAAQMLMPLDDLRWTTVRTFLGTADMVELGEAEACMAPRPDGIVPLAPVRAALFRPLEVHGERRGVVIVQSHQAGAYQAREHEILRSMAAFAAIALSNASAYTAEEAARHEADRTLQELRQAQGQLVQSEKMAALGQLVAGVAHEINTPLGAVKASARNILASLRECLDELPELLQRLDLERLAQFRHLLELASAAPVVLSSREERALLRRLLERLTAEQVPQAEDLAGLLAQMQIDAELPACLPLLHSTDGLRLTRAAFALSAVARNAENINAAVDRVAKIVFALRTYSRFDAASEPVLADVTQGLETVLTIYHSQIKQHVELVRHYDPVEPLLCWPDELNQVWTNLIQNALQAMQYRGRLEISVSAEAGQVVVSIRDSGAGIAEEVLPRIFDAFFTTKPMGVGSGLGLDIVNKIVAKHGGRIDVESTPGLGSCFRVSLPHARGEPAGDGAREARAG